MCACKYGCTNVCVCMCVCMCIYIYIYIICVHLCMWVCVYIYIYICACIFMICISNAIARPWGNVGCHLNNDIYFEILPQNPRSQSRAISPWLLLLLIIIMIIIIIMIVMMIIIVISSDAFVPYPRAVAASPIRNEPNCKWAMCILCSGISRIWFIHSSNQIPCSSNDSFVLVLVV